MELWMSVANGFDQIPLREEMHFDIVIVGAGPAGLAASIRLKQKNPELSVIVIEKGAEVGAHIVSGAVMDPRGLDQLLPNWQENRPDFFCSVTADDYFYLSQKKRYKIANTLLPKEIKNNGNYIISLGQCCKWLAKQAEQLGVEIYTGFSGSELLYDEKGAVKGVGLDDKGLNVQGQFTAESQRGMALLGRYIFLAEGARGSLSKQAIAKFQLQNKDAPQKFSLGLKEIWEIDSQDQQKGLVQHFIGWPLEDRYNGGGFLYHMDNGKISIGYVVHLDYDNPYLSPFEVFQQFKTHPTISSILQKGRRISYGARVISEGGWQSVPRLVFPGGALLGCSAGFVNVPRIKGSHNAILSGILAADAALSALQEGRCQDVLLSYEDGWRKSLIGQELYRARNFKPLLKKFGTKIGGLLGGIDLWMQQFLGISFWGTLSHGKNDAQSLEFAQKSKKIIYPKPDGKISFDRLSSVALTHTNYEKDRPNHLKIFDMELQYQSEYLRYAGPSTRYCPAAVYEWVKQGDQMNYIVNSGNCIQCKTCDLKDPNGNIEWNFFA